MASVPGAEAAVAAANAAYYAAFEARDLDAMAEVWERSDRVPVTHPGWPTLHGWARVAGSWDAIFANTAFIQFVLTDEVGARRRRRRRGSRATRTSCRPAAHARAARMSPSCRAGASPRRTCSCYDDGRWRMVLHHGSPGRDRRRANRAEQPTSGYASSALRSAAWSSIALAIAFAARPTNSPPLPVTQSHDAGGGVELAL